MRYPGNGGGDFAKFENVGDKYVGTYIGTRQVAGKFEGDQSVVDIKTDAGKTVSVRLNLKAIGAQWANAIAAQPARVGERISFEFVGKYDSKRFGAGRGKDVVIDFLDRGPNDAPPAGGATAGAPPTGDAVEAALARVTEKVGAEQAAQILRAVQSVYKNTADHADALLKAVKLA